MNACNRQSGASRPMWTCGNWQFVLTVMGQLRRYLEALERRQPVRRKLPNGTPAAAARFAAALGFNPCRRRRAERVPTAGVFLAGHCWKEFRTGVP
jgi:hypothetical protein